MLKINLLLLLSFNLILGSEEEKEYTKYEPLHYKIISSFCYLSETEYNQLKELDSILVDKEKELFSMNKNFNAFSQLNSNYISLKKKRNSSTYELYEESFISTIKDAHSFILIKKLNTIEQNSSLKLENKKLLHTKKPKTVFTIM